MIALLFTGCLVLDGFVHNPVHCSTVDEQTCEETPWDPEWDAICLACDEPYDWEEEHPWLEGTLSPGQTVRPVLEGEFTGLTLETLDGQGTLDLYWFYSHGERSELADLTLIYNHGNYAGLEHYAPRVRFLVEAGFNVVAWDYRGYGKSMPETAPSTEQFLQDASQVRTFVAEQGIPDAQVVIYAYSLGGVPAMEMVLNRPACALIWETGFTGIGPMTTANTGTSYGGSMLSTGGLESTEKIKDWSGPTLVMIGTEDHVFSVEDERRVFDNAPGPKDFWEVQGAHHGIADKGIPEHVGLTPYFGRLQGFLADQAQGCAGR
jgi:alpha-beta hydrolase superfamily lysophospholipase